MTEIKDPSWYDRELKYLTYRDIVEVFQKLFGKLFADYVFTRFFDEIKARQLRNEILHKHQVDELLKNRGK